MIKSSWPLLNSSSSGHCLTRVDDRTVRWRWRATMVQWGQRRPVSIVRRKALDIAEADRTSDSLDECRHEKVKKGQQCDCGHHTPSHKGERWSSSEHGLTVQCNDRRLHCASCAVTRDDLRWSTFACHSQLRLAGLHRLISLLCSFICSSFFSVWPSQLLLEARSKERHWATEQHPSYQRSTLCTSSAHSCFSCSFPNSWFASTPVVCSVSYLLACPFTRDSSCSTRFLFVHCRRL